MSRRKQKAIVRRFINEIYNKGNLSVLDDLADNQLVFHGAQDTEDIQQLKQAIRHVRDNWDSIFKELHFTIDDIFIDGDRVVVRLMKRGIFKNNFGRSNSSGQRCDIPATEIFRFSGDKLQEIWSNS